MLVATIGNFDGVHLGHRAIVAAARDAAGPAGRVVAVTFEPLPVAVLRPDVAPARLTDAAARRDLLRAAGCDEVVELDPRQGILKETPEAFVAGLRSRIPFDAVAEGGDFRFGAGRSGDVATLAAILPVIAVTLLASAHAAQPALARSRAWRSMLVQARDGFHIGSMLDRSIDLLGQPASPKEIRHA